MLANEKKTLLISFARQLPREKKFCTQRQKPKSNHTKIKQITYKEYIAQLKAYNIQIVRKHFPTNRIYKYV